VGGGAAISACGLAKLGSRTGVIGVVGRDNGEWLANRLNRFGVITSQIRFDPIEPTAVTVAVSTPQDRSFLTYRGANGGFPLVLATAAASGHFACARHVHLTCALDLETASDLLTAIRAQGCSISLDVGWHEDWLADPRAAALLPMLDIFLPNQVEARRMTGEAGPEEILRRLASEGARRVALKLGQDGAALWWDGAMLRSAPHQVNAIDTTGAGDCFNAGFLHFWLQGASPLTCLRAANFCGAASTEQYGGLTGFPDLERVKLEITDIYA
jgi:sugar/nucleoside kinase (ribokinase family)